MPTSWVVTLVLILVGVVYAAVVWHRRRIEGMYQFLQEVKVELRKVTWPSRREVLGTTSVVIVTVFFFGLFLSVVDVIVTWARNGIFDVAGVGRGPGL